MRFLAATTAMKGSLSALQCSRIISKSIERAVPGAQCISLPLADGGNGTLDCLVHATNGKFFSKEVCGPLPSMIVNARWGVSGDGENAIIEMAEAAGLHHIQPDAETIVRGTTYGVGELILEAVKTGYHKILIGLGGSATNDGGTGMARALHARFLDSTGIELPDEVQALSRLSHIQWNNSLLRDVRITALSDVTVPLCGKLGATALFAKQKGATDKQIPLLDAALKHYAEVLKFDLNADIAEVPGSGAAGGLGAGLAAFCNAPIVSGIQFILETIGFDEKLANCDHVVTTEGQLDEQTLFGKGIAGITARADRFKKPVHAFAGKIHGDAGGFQRRLGLASLVEISPPEMKPKEALANAHWLLADAVYQHFKEKTNDNSNS